jgi:hypothetical protein
MRGMSRAAVAAVAPSTVSSWSCRWYPSVAGPNVLRIHVIEHATTDTVVDPTANGDSTGDLLRFHNEVSDEDDQTVIGTSHATASGSRSA